MTAKTKRVKARLMYEDGDHPGVVYSTRVYKNDKAIFILDADEVEAMVEQMAQFVIPTWHRWRRNDVFTQAFKRHGIVAPKKGRKS